MTTNLDPTLLPALDAIFGKETVRRYAPEPAADYHVECFRRQCERDANLRELMADREADAERAVSGDAEDFFAAEQCPSDRHFGR
jgi:hypothetical protein